MSHELSKSYEPGAIERRWAEYWIEQRLFHVHPAKDNPRPVFSLLLPPPNVTGFLHMGHMFEQTQMDIMIRWRRMRGFLTLWLPGTDHAGIGTQMMVERQLQSEGKKREQLGREAFIERVWEWRRHYGGAILDQMKRLGASVDWDREYFTMDENLSRAVREVFVRLYDEGLIYRGRYIVNWCPRCGTAVSDLEVKHEEVAGKLYEIRYPVVGTNEFITVATTRPETMLGDTAVAVNEKDERYQHLQGKKVRLPLMNREIPIITDELANPEFGTGAVKVTPAHDPNDFEAGLRHNLPQIDVMDAHARMNQNAGPYAGLDRFEARSRIVQDLEAEGLLVRIKDHTIPLGKCDRCRTIVEPRLSAQWFVKVEPLAKRAIEVVEKGYVRFTPENYKQVYLNWMYNIHDWCISRQLWWGHRIPAWRCVDCNTIIVARETPTKCTKCPGSRLEQDPDVLDTWFSSGLLPFTALGWPDATRDLEIFYPTSLLITGFDILFFWVARMIMLGCWFMAPPHKPLRAEDANKTAEDGLRESVPFREVYIHALVRDADRQKMSKTKGNVLDPIEVIEQYGTDATRFTLASMAAPGTDIAFNASRTAGYRNFANKIWNASRFMFMNLDRVAPGLRPESGGSTPEAGVAGFEAFTLEDRWILSRFNRVAGEVNEALEAYRFDDAARAIYDYFWGELCDWYIELIKPRLSTEDGAGKEAAQRACRNLVNLFEASIRLLHPVMPFITEEIWHALYDGRPPLKSVALAAYPVAQEKQSDLSAETEMSVLQDLIVSVRNLRAELAVEQKQRVPIQIFTEETAIRTLIEQNRGAVERLANVEKVTFAKDSLAKLSSVRHTARFDVHVVYEKQIDAAVERGRLKKELERIEKEIANGQRQLGNDQFLSKAPAQVVEGLRRRAQELTALREKTQSKLQELH
ncbi:MAG: valine--tRNA ligase [Acidobacteria bacterium]|nr:MAG: valine--tRNA ligase [Acidobacteriota bacterium]PYX16459.1 MAG: valine--tRNA ligase [Acidobacteriota bacterium]